MSLDIKNPTILKILDYYKDLWALSHVSAVSGWDLETYMPPKGAAARGQALGRIATIRQRLFLDPNFVALIEKANNQKGLSDSELGIVRILNRALDFYQKVPAKFLEDFENLTNEASVIWRQAKKENNFKLFEKPLSKIFEMNRQKAEYIGYKNSPYDALLDEYEEDLTTKVVDNLFNLAIPKLQDLLDKIKSSKKYFKVHDLESTKYSKEEMSKLNDKILKYLWVGYGDNFRLDISSHPFTTSFSKNDTRITTWYHDTDFARSILATIHEFGHALYDLQSSDTLEMTPIAGGSSLVIHESQSRFWENHVGRSYDFIEKFLNDFKVVTGKKNLKTEDVFSYFNKVRPSLLRVEADEVTYHMHIAIRYEIEKDVIEGKLKIKNLKEVWNQKMKDYLGVVPSKDSEGVLQDIHWSMGSVGYFPTYSLGTFLSSQWRAKLEDSLKSKDYSGIQKWLGQNIHKYGSTYTLETLLEKRKMKYDPLVNINYLIQKYTKIYDLN